MKFIPVISICICIRSQVLPNGCTFVCRPVNVGADYRCSEIRANWGLSRPRFVSFSTVRIRLCSWHGYSAVGSSARVSIIVGPRHVNEEIRGRQQRLEYTPRDPVTGWSTAPGPGGMATRLEAVMVSSGLETGL